MALSPFFFGFWTKPFLKEKRLFYYPELNLHKILYTTETGKKTTTKRLFSF